MNEKRLRTHVSKAIAKKTPYTEHSIQDEKSQINVRNSFNHDRFEHYADTHGSATIAGSTFANDKETSSEFILDASSTSYMVDSHGVRTGIAMATGDGLGHFPDQKENERIADITSYACQEFTSAVVAKENIDQTTTHVTLAEIAYNSVQRFHEPNKDQTPECSLTTTIVQNVSQKQQGIWANIGDGMVITLDKNFQVKGLLPARVFRNMGGWSPMSLQRFNKPLTQDPYAGSLDIEALSFNEDDWIIHMTDGVWSEFATSKIQRAKYHDIAWSSKTFTTELANKLQNRDNPSAHEVAKSMIELATEQTLAKRQKFIDLQVQIEPFLQEARRSADEINKLARLTIREWLSDKENSEELCSNVEKLMDQCAEKGKTYHNKLNTSACSFKNDLKNVPQLQQCKHYSEVYEQLMPYIKQLEDNEVKLKELYETYNKKTIGAWCDEHPDLKEAIEAYMTGSEHDDVVYKEGLNTPAYLIFNDIQRKRFGDCATISVMQVPDPKVELVRALLEYPENTSVLLPRIHRENLQGTRLDNILERLKNETYLPRERGKGVKLNDLDKKFIYTEAQRNHVESVIKQYFEQINHLGKELNLAQSKQDNQDIFKKSINTLNIDSRSALFDKVSQGKEEVLNQHRNPKLDKLLNVHNTNSWRSTWKEIRDNARQELFEKVDQALKEDGSDQEKLIQVAAQFKRLKLALNQDLFSKHRNNRWYKGAFGNTETVNQINNRMNSLHRQAEGLLFKEIDNLAQKKDNKAALELIDWAKKQEIFDFQPACTFGSMFKRHTLSIISEKEAEIQNQPVSVMER